MNAWSTNDARAVATPQEIQVVTTRADGTRRTPTTIWIVADADRIFLRSTNGRLTTDSPPPKSRRSSECQWR